MSSLHRRGVALGLAFVSGVLGCSGPSATPPPDSSTAGAGAATGGLGAGATAGTSNPGGGADSVGGATGNGGTSAAGTTGSTVGGMPPLPTGVEPSALIPQRIRRLTNAEFDASVRALTGTTKALGQKFSPDARQDGFTVNDAQRVDNVTAKQIYAAAQELAAEVKANLATHAPCADMSASDTCAKTFIAAFGQKAYRRPLSAEESSGLFTVYQTGASGAAYADGIELAATAALNSAGFLYLTELGAGPPVAATTAVALTPYELASALSYLVTAGPPSEQLVADALAGNLDTPEGREAAFNSLIFGTSVAQDRVVRVVREWLGVDRIGHTDKDSNVYPAFQGMKAAMEFESQAFITRVITESTGDVKALLSAEWTDVGAVPGSDLLAGLYGASGTGKVNLPTRRGILNQAAFLSVFAHAHESAPVLRGVEIAKRLACMAVPSPTTLNIAVVPPQPDPAKTTRERFTVHSTDPECRGCHDTIDPFGFAFEGYDGMGRFRTMENNRPVDSKVTVALSTDFDGSFADGNALALKLSDSAQVRACFARHVFRASAARSDATVSASEAAFIKYWQTLDPQKQGNVLETLVTFVKSPLFTHRRGS